MITALLAIAIGTAASPSVDCLPPSCIVLEAVREERPSPAEPTGTVLGNSALAGTGVPLALSPAAAARVLERLDDMARDLAALKERQALDRARFRASVRDVVAVGISGAADIWTTEDGIEHPAPGYAVFEGNGLGSTSGKRIALKTASNLAGLGICSFLRHHDLDLAATVLRWGLTGRNVYDTVRNVLVKKEPELFVSVTFGVGGKR